MDPKIETHTPPIDVKETRRYDKKLYVAGLGPPTADIMFIATAVSDEEVEDKVDAGYNQFIKTQPKYLKGPAGCILKDLLMGCGVNIDEHYYTALVKRWLPKTERSKPSKEDIIAGEIILQKEIARVQPKIIVTFGKAAFEAVIPDKLRFTQIEACWFYSEEHSAKVFVMPEVSMLVWKPELVESFSIDLQEVSSMLKETRGIVTNKTKEDFGVISTADELIQFVDMLVAEQAYVLSVDTEFGGKTYLDTKIRSMQICWKPGFARYIRFMDSELNYVFDVSYKEAGAIINKHWNNPLVKVIGHHISADLPLIYHWLGLAWYNKTLLDTEFAEQALHENASHRLERLSLKYTTAGRYDADLIRWKANNKSKVTDVLGYLLVPDDILIPYSLRDVTVPMEAFPAIVKGLKTDNVLEFYTNFVNPLVGNIFTEFTLKGLPVNVDKMDGLRHVYSYARTLLEKDLVEKLVVEAEQLLLNELLLVNSDPMVGLSVFKEIKDCVKDGKSHLAKEKALEVFKKFIGPAKLMAYLPFMEHFLMVDTFKISSTAHKVRWLFSVKKFKPIKSTNQRDKGRPSMSWASVENLKPNVRSLYTPAADRQTVKMLADETGDLLLLRMLDVMAVANICKIFLKPATLDEDGELVRENGLHYWLAADNRIHGLASCTETWRPRSWKPNVLNWPSQTLKAVERAITGVLEKEDAEGNLLEEYKGYMQAGSIPSLRSVIDVEFLEPLPGSEGWCLVESDYVTAEIRGMAYISGDANLINLVSEADFQFGIPKDPAKEHLRVRLRYADDCGFDKKKQDPKFLMTAAENGKIIATFSEDELAKDAAGNFVHPPHDLHWSLVEWLQEAPRELFDSKKDRGGCGKTGNFSTAYGATAGTLERQIHALVGKPPEPGTGMRILEALRKRQPVATEFLETMANIPKTDGEWQAESGAKRRFISHRVGVKGLKERDTQSIFSGLGRQARNFPFQHSVSATAIRATHNLLNHCINNNLASRPMACLYDSIVTLAKIEERFEVLRLHEKYMTTENVWHDHGRTWFYTSSHELNMAWSAKPKEAVRKKLHDRTWANDYPSLSIV